MRCLLVLVGLAAGCGVADFDITQPIPEQQVAGSPIPGPLAMLFPLPLSFDISAKIKAMTTGPIGSVTLTSLELDLTATAQPSGDTDDWSFVDEVDVFVSSSKSGTTLPKVKIAHVTSPGAVKKMTFVVETGVNLDPYVNEGSVVDSTSAGRVPPDDVSYNGNAVFTVHPL